MLAIDKLQQQLQQLADPKQQAILQRFFKTAPGEYGEGDIFLGIKVPILRKIAKHYKGLSLTDIQFASLTNGSRLKGEIAEIFAHKGSWIRVSMDGWNDESYSTYRNIKPGAFSSLLKNMEEFKKISGGCLLGVSIIVDKKNSDHLYELIKKLKNIINEMIRT